MAIEDWIPDFDGVPEYPVCKHCGKPIAFLRDEYSMKWKPINPGGSAHRCPALYAKPSDFPKLED